VIKARGGNRRKDYTHFRDTPGRMDKWDWKKSI